MYATENSRKSEEKSFTSVELDSHDKKNLPNDPERARFPFCIVWTTLPMFSQIIPIIGHTGVCKYVKLDNKIYNDSEWDAALHRADEKYRGMMHNFCCNNCHSHVACFLNELGYKGKKNWNMVNIWWMCLAESHYVKLRYILNIYILIFIAVIVIIIKQFI